MEVKRKRFSRDMLHIDDIEKCCDNIVSELRKNVLYDLNRRGCIVGISGGIDSSVVLALSTLALGKERVVGVMLPEMDSSYESLVLAKELASKFGVRTVTEEITGALEGFGCYERRDEAIKNVIKDFDPIRDKSKIEIKQNISSGLPSLFTVTVIKDKGEIRSKLLPAKEYLQVVAATNFKQRSRMAMLYYHAELNHYAVIGTPNKHEVDQGFFVKYGDGGADVMPIAHLYKTQVYQLAEYLGIPSSIISRTPTTDTYSAEQSQEDFYYQMPFESLDLIWYGWENKYDPAEVAKTMDHSKEEIENIYKSFERKVKSTDYLRMRPIF